MELLPPSEWTAEYVAGHLRRICDAHPSKMNPRNAGGSCIYDDGRGNHCLVGVMLAEHEAVMPDAFGEAPLRPHWRESEATAKTVLDLLGAPKAAAVEARAWQAIADGDDGGGPAWKRVPGLVRTSAAHRTAAASC